MKKLIGLWILICLLNGCGSSASAPATVATLQSVRVSAPNTSIATGASEQLSATGTYSDGTTKDLTASATWTTANGSVANVSSAGVVTGVSAGSAMITASISGSSGSTTITITPVISFKSAVSMGINIGGVSDWDPTQMFADAMKQARKFGNPATPYDELASVDANGWPTQDAGVAVLINNQGHWAEGTYALSFQGQATVKAWNDSNVAVSAVSYNSATNTSTATVTVSPNYQSVYLVFSQTQRTPTSAIGSGVTQVQLMRPTISGSPHAQGALFTDRFLARLKYFNALRMMDYLATNSSTEKVWTDRSIPTHASQQQVPPHASGNVMPQYVTGASYEYAIQLANASGKDLWINIPHLAMGGDYHSSDSTWATNLALLLRYGSDASGNPYTGVNGSSGANPQPASGPVNAPLNSGLHVYIEWSNEFWSGVGNQSTWLEAQAKSAIAAQDSDLDWDNDTSVYDMEWRIEARGLMQIANAFSSVYGSTGFGNIYRPIYAGQIASSGTYGGLQYLEARYGGAHNFVWAVAGAPYVDFNGDVSNNTLSATQILSAMQSYQSANISSWVASLSSLASTYQLSGGMVAYEGGPSTQAQTAGAVAAQTMPAMRSISTTLFNSWYGAGGGTFFYYKLCSANTWGLATQISYDIDTDAGYANDPTVSTEAQPKWGAIRQVGTLGH